MQTYTILEVLYYKQRDDTAVQGYSRGGSKQTSKPMNCEKFVVLRDLTGRAGANICKIQDVLDFSYTHDYAQLNENATSPSSSVTVLMGRNKNSRLYDQHIQGRDAGSFSKYSNNFKQLCTMDTYSDAPGPGAILVLESPRPVNTWLGQSVPTLDIPGSWKVVNPDTIELPDTPIQQGSPRQHAFHYRRVQLQILNFDPLETNCMGDMCDALGKEYGGEHDIYAQDTFGVHNQLI